MAFSTITSLPQEQTSNNKQVLLVATFIKVFILFSELLHIKLKL